MILKLPFPVTVNHYYVPVMGKSKTGKTYMSKCISKRGQDFRVEVFIAFAQAKFEPFGKDRLRMVVQCHPPSKRKYDLDNLGKSLLDALEFAGAYDDDEQIEDLQWLKRESIPPGHVLVTIEAI